MPNPTPSDVHVNALATNASVAYLQSSTQFVARKVFPTLPVMTRSGVYALYNQDDFMRDEVGRRGVGATPNRLEYRTNNSGSYNCEEWAADQLIDDQVSANAQAPYNPVRDAARFVTQKMLISAERDWVTSYFSTGDLWTGSSDAQDLIGGTDFTRWSNAASDPVGDILKWKKNVISKTGIAPNTVVLGLQVWNDTQNHPDIIDRVKHTSDGPVSADIVARLFGVDRVLVSQSAYHSNNQGETVAGAMIAGDDILLVYSAPSPGLMVPSGGYTFIWNGLIGSAEGQRILSFRDKDEIGDVVRIQAAFDHKVVASDVGVFANDASTNA